MTDQTIHFTLNDASVTCLVPSYWTLHDLLRNVSASADLPDACPEGDCCRCTVLLDRRAVCACHVLALEAAGSTVHTRDGLAGHPVVAALEHPNGACGRCVAAFALAAIDHLENTEHDAGPRLEASLLAIPCDCHIESEVRQVVRHLAHDRRREAL
jgi:carbon-monoxide dehydrogenase small subunit